MIGGGGDRVGGGTGSAAGVEEAPALAAQASFIAFASIILLEASITDPTSKTTKIRAETTIQNYNTHRGRGMQVTWHNIKRVK